MPFTEKHLTVPPPIEVAGRWVKRYHVTADPAGIAPEVQESAYRFLPDAAAEAGRDTAGDVRRPAPGR